MTGGGLEGCGPSQPPVRRNQHHFTVPTERAPSSESAGNGRWLAATMTTARGPSLPISASGLLGVSARSPCEKALELAKFFIGQARIQDLASHLYPFLHALCDASDDEGGSCVNHNQITLCAAITVGKDIG
jgi:hypothetical protein